MLYKLTCKLPVLAAALISGALFALVPAHLAGAAPPSGTCQAISLAVRLAPLLPKDQTAVGDLCLPTTWAEGDRNVDVLVHGGSYNRTYWDFPVSYPDYSYVERTLQQGRATFAYDRLGSGDSSRPLSVLATVDADAYILHQVINWLRAHGTDFGKVNIIGHSFGSITALKEQAIHNDADRFVVTGVLHAEGPGLAEGFAGFTPAALDPQFSGQGYDLGYFTTTAATRASLFYSGTVDQDVIDYDIAHKDVLASGQFPELLQVFEPPIANPSFYVTADVLVLAGQHDDLFCGLLLDCTNTGAVVANETPYYASAASLTVQTVADTGHNLALHPSADASFDTINQWIESH